MRHFCDSYPYFVFSVGFLLLFAGLSRLASVPLRRFALAGAAMALPAAFEAWIDMPAYWNPARLVVVAGVGMEDFMAVFALGGLCCLLAGFPWRPRWSEPLWTRRLWLRYLTVMGLGLGVRLLFEASGVSISSALIGSTAAMVPVLLGLRPRCGRLALSGALCFGAAYVLALRACFWLAPHWRAQWNQGGLWAWTAWGLPLEECLWALLLGASCPLAVSYVFRVEWRPWRAGERGRGVPGAPGRQPPE